MNDVFIPLFMGDIHHLMEVYIDYRKHMLLSALFVCCNHSHLHRMSLLLRVYYVILIALAVLSVYFSMKVSKIPLDESFFILSFYFVDNEESSQDHHINTKKYMLRNKVKAWMVLRSITKWIESQYLNWMRQCTILISRRVIGKMRVL